jgi:hypothetical protein
MLGAVIDWAAVAVPRALLHNSEGVLIGDETGRITIVGNRQDIGVPWRSAPSGGPIAFGVNVKEEHKIDIEALEPAEREQLRSLLLTVVGKSS